MTSRETYCLKFSLVLNYLRQSASISQMLTTAKGLSENWEQNPSLPRGGKPHRSSGSQLHETFLLPLCRSAVRTMLAMGARSWCWAGHSTRGHRWLPCWATCPLLLFLFLLFFILFIFILEKWQPEYFVRTQESLCCLLTVSTACFFGEVRKIGELKKIKPWGTCACEFVCVNTSNDFTKLFS